MAFDVGVPHRVAIILSLAAILSVQAVPRPASAADQPSPAAAKH